MELPRWPAIRVEKAHFKDYGHGASSGICLPSGSISNAAHIEQRFGADMVEQAKVESQAAEMQP